MATEPTSTAPGRRDGDGVRRVLVVANEVVGGSRLVEEVVRRARARAAQVRIVSPALVDSPLKLGAGEVDEAIEDARRRLEGSVHALEQEGVEASGDVGEADPNLAIQDALALFPADEVIIIAHPRERATWLEEDVVERAQRELSVPITFVEVEPTDGTVPAVKKVEEIRPAPEGPRQRREEGEADYGPPMSTRDKLALLIGIVGTIVLGAVALGAGDVPMFTLLLAIGAFMVTVWHVAALLIMRSSGYRGRWADLAADTILFGIPPAVVLGVILA
jgi:hypothetical protein